MKSLSSVGWIRVIMLSSFLLAYNLLQAQVNYRHFVLAGRIDLSEERFFESIRNFNTALRYNGDNFEAYFLRGVAKFNLSDYQGALDDFSKTLEIHPLYVRAWHYRGITHDRMSNYFDAKADFARALEIDPYNADLHIANGATSMHLNEFKAAIESYDMALLINPRLSTAYLNRGIAKRFLDQLDEALEDLDKAVYLDYFSTEAWLRRGMVRLELDNYKAAMEDFNQALELDNQNPLVYFQRALAFLQSGDTLAALKDYEQVNVLDKRNALTYYNRALLRSMREEYELALPLYDLVTAINPQNVYAWFNRGVTYFQLKEYPEAVEDFSKAIELFPDFAGAWINRSVARDKMNDSKGSRADYEQAMSIIKALNNKEGNPDSLYARYADSTYFDQIFELESDFISGESRKTRVQFREIDIVPFGLISLMPFPERAKTDPKPDYFMYSDLFVSQLNSELASPLNFLLTTAPAHHFMTLAERLSALSDEHLPADFAEALNQQIKGNYQKAIEAYEKLITHQDWGFYATLNLSVVLAERAELVLSSDSYDNAIMITRRKSTQVPVVTEDKAPDYQPAKEMLQQLLPTELKNGFAWYNMGNIHLQMQNFHPAIDAYSEAISFEPTLAEAYYNRALTLLFLGENELACNDLSKAGELGLSEAYAVIKRYCQ
ncbi:MAG: tetratricopeptide repeat protein [Bacteroidetes bacterium]|nr:tetratricopeptide repeat protein [Bacteroidota bacterium]